MNDSKSKENKKEAEIQLSIHPEMVDSLSNFQMETIKEEIEALPPINEGDVNISTDYVFDMGDKYEVSIFIRNGLKRSVNFERLPLMLMNEKNENLCNKVFNLRMVGDIPPMSVRPWKIYFLKEEVNLGEMDLSNLKVVFDSSIKAESTVKVQLEDLPEQIQGSNKTKLEDFMKKLPLLRSGEISISTYDVFFDVENGLSVVLVIRNGSSKSIKAEKIPVCVRDASKDIIAKGVFQLDNEDVVINSLKAKLCRFVFPQEEILVDKIDLNNWAVTFNE